LICRQKSKETVLRNQLLRLDIHRSYAATVYRGAPASNGSQDSVRSSADLDAFVAEPCPKSPNAPDGEDSEKPTPADETIRQENVNVSAGALHQPLESVSSKAFVRQNSEKREVPAVAAVNEAEAEAGRVTPTTQPNEAAVENATSAINIPTALTPTNRKQRSAVDETELPLPDCTAAASPAQFFIDDLPSALQNLMTIPEDEALHHGHIVSSQNLQPFLGYASPSCGRLVSLASPDVKPSPRLLQQVLSQPRISETGSFVMPSHWETYCNFDCGFFSHAPEDVGFVKDISLLPAPSPSLVAEVNHAPVFTVGDEDAVDDDKSSSVSRQINESIPRAPPTVAENSTTVADMKKSKIEMVDATPRDILAEIFNRTAGG
jgi:hypothetical protein